MDIDRYIKKLGTYGRKTISNVQLRELFSVNDDEELFPIVKELEQEEILQPVKTCKTNGNSRFTLYLKYRISVPEDDFETELREISQLHPALQTDGFLQSKPAEYKKHRDYLQRLDRYLFSNHTDRVPVSRKERSFEIFGEEKALDGSALRRLLEKLKLGKQELAFYDTPEFCFNDFIPERKQSMTLLICENKDIWYNIRRRMFENDADTIFGVHIDGVVYGCGNQVSQKNALTSYTEFMGGTEVSYLYWGDIDRAGLNIYLSLIKNNPNLRVQIFIPAYENMLTRARKITVPDSEDGRERLGDYSEIFSRISEENREYMMESITLNKRIPQEIITYEDLLQCMR